MDFCCVGVPDESYRRVLERTRTTLNDLAKTRPSPGVFGRDEWRFCGELGLLGFCVPEEFGGQGQDPLTTAHVFEAFGRGCHDMGLVFSVAAHLFACAMPIAEFGSPELKRAVLARLCAGDWIGAHAISEADAGSDVFALTTRAERDGDAYVLTGDKSYVTNGPVADLVVVYASTDQAHGCLGITAFAVETDMPGLARGESLPKIGLASSPASSIQLRECRVPAARRLGAEGQGAQVFQRSMQWERSCLFATYVGMLDRQLEQTIAYARRRRQFGRPIGKNQAVSHTIANMKLRLEAARLLLYRACWLFAQHRDAALETSLAKLAISEGAIQSGLEAFHIHAGAGSVAAPTIEWTLRDALLSTIFSGTSEMQRDVIARELGL